MGAAVILVAALAVGRHRSLFGMLRKKEGGR
jgi:hypothetical protein